MKYTIPLFRVLLVEDQPALQKIHQTMLRFIGYRADIAEYGEEALYMTQITPYDLIFMDIGLPDMDGREVTAKIRQSKISKNAITIGLTA